MAAQPVVGAVVEYHNKEKGTTTKYEITGTIPGFLLLKNLETGKGNKLRTDSKIYTEIFGETEEQSKPAENQEASESVNTQPDTEDAKETVDMSKYIDNDSKPEPKKAEPKPDTDIGAKETEQAKPERKKQPVYDRELDVFNVEYTPDDPVIHQVFELKKTKAKGFEIMIGLMTDNNAVRKMVTFSLFAWKNRTKFNIDRYELNDALANSTRTKSLHDFTILDHQALCKAIMHTVETKEGLQELVNLLPTEQEYAHLICQMICDGGYTDWGFSLKGLEQWIADLLVDRALAMTEKGL